MPTIHTIGHSNKTGAEFAALLVDHEIDTVIDCRTSPWSRWPDFNGPQLKKLLMLSSVRYEQRGKNLGGKGVNVDYDESIAEMAERAGKGEKIALMCSEGNFADCHRFTMLTPSMLEAGVDVLHIVWRGTDQLQTVEQAQRTGGILAADIPPAPKHEPLFDWDLPTVVKGRNPKWVTP